MRLTLAQQVLAAGLVAPELEFAFAKAIGRRWRFDYAWPQYQLAIEVEGGAFTRGRHTRGAGFVKDIEKYNAAALMGYTVLRVTPRMVRDGTALGLVEQAFHSVGNRLVSATSHRQQ